MTGSFSSRARVCRLAALAALAVAGLIPAPEARASPEAGIVLPPSIAGADRVGLAPSPKAEPLPVRLAGGDCSSAAAQAAADSGGQVLSVSSRQQGGRTVCVVTVLVPGKDGSRPRKRTITIPQ